MRPWFKGTFLCSDKELESQQTSFGWWTHLNRIKAQSIGGCGCARHATSMDTSYDRGAKQQNSLEEAGDGSSQQLVGLKNILLARLLAAILWQIKNPCYFMPTVALIMPFNGFLFVEL